MKKLLLILFVTINIQSTMAQTYVPFPDSNATWNVGVLNGNHTYKIIGDSIFNGFTYKKYYRAFDTVSANQQFIFRAIVRQDIPNKKVFAIPAGEVNEKLIYAFNLNINDTISVYTFDFGCQFPPLKVKVTAKDSLLVNSAYRKRLTLTGSGFPNGVGWEYWIEGIGSSYGVFNSGLCDCSITDGCYPLLMCHTKNGILNFINPLSNACFAPSCVGTGLKESNSVASGIKIYPNPTSTYFELDLKSTNQTFRLKILDALGREIQEQKISNGSKVNIEDLAQGIYFIKLYSEENILIGQEKLVKQD